LTFFFLPPHSPTILFEETRQEIHSSWYAATQSTQLSRHPLTQPPQSDGEDDTKSQVSAAAEVEVSADATGSKGQMSVLEALKGVLKLALIHDGLARGLREASKALDRRQAHMCVLNEACEEEAYKKLVVALCSEHKIPLIKVPDGKQLGEWAGLCTLSWWFCGIATEANH
jgi:small subunit ribosomal protein S12e